MLAWRIGFGVLAVGLAVGCATDPPPAQTDDGTDGAATETGGGEPDMPSAPAPECPAALGELVECECGFIDGCTLVASDKSSCALSCPLELACETIDCEFDIAHGEPACVSVLNPEAIDCVFAALLSGAPIRVALELSNTYPFISHTETLTLTRLGPERLLRTHASSESNDIGQSSSSWYARVHELTDAMFEECMAADYPEAAVDCLFGLSAEASSCTELPTCEP